MPELQLPSDAEIRAQLNLLEPYRRLIQPHVSGTEHIPATGPVLLVGNHTVLGLQDMPFMMLEVLRRTGRPVHGLADHLHFTIPVWRDLLRRGGGVPGTRENCAALMRMGRVVLVYPGGAREVNKRKGEAYKLMWKERIGFARMAVQNNCPIVPFAALGAEDRFDIVLDHDSAIYAPFRALAERLTGRDDVLGPIVRGIGPTPIPRPERFYFRFFPPIDVTRWAGRAEDKESMHELRDEVKATIESGIDALKDERDDDPDRSFRRRVVKAVRGGGEIDAPSDVDE